MGPFQIGDTPFQGNVILNIDFWRRLWTRFGTTKECAPHNMFFLISMKWSAEKGIRRSRSQVPVNTFLSLAELHPCLVCFHWLPTWTCAISIASLLTLSPHCCCLVKLLCECCWRVFPLTPPCELALFCLPLCWLSAAVSWSCFLAKYYSISR